MLILFKNAMWFTFCRVGQNARKSSACRFSRARQAPRESQKAQDLPAEIGGQNQKPGNEIARSDSITQGAEEIAIADSTVRSENGISDIIDNKRHDHEAEEEKTGKERQLFGR
jgi:hypothetical protein